MRRLRALLIALPLAFGCVTGAIAQTNASDIVRQATDGFIRPAYQSLRDETGKLHVAMRDLCAAPAQPKLDAARQAFAGTVAAWSRAEIIRFGPIAENNRLERMLFWPDRKSIGLKQVQAALASKDPSATDPATLGGKSVAMQGLGALEFVLHGAGAEGLATPDDAYRCAYGAAIAGNIEMIASEVDDAWTKPDGFAALWASPGPQNPLYRDPTEAVTELMEVFINGLELVRDVRVRGFLGRTAQDDRPKQAVYWRSGQTGASLAGNLAGMEALFDASHLGDALAPDSQWLAQSARAQFGNGVKAAEAAQGRIDEVLADPASREKLTYFSLVTTSLSELFGTRIAGEFGLSAGFSSLDGD